MGRAANRKWAARRVRYRLAGARERSRLRVIFGWRIALSLVALLLVAAPARAQVADVCTGVPDKMVCTGPITANMRFEWTAADNVPTVAVAEALTPRVYVDQATTFVELSGDTCTGAAPPLTCTAPIPAALLAVLNVSGVHSVTLRMFDPAQGLEGPSAVPFVLRSPPGAPSRVRIIR